MGSTSLDVMIFIAAKKITELVRRALRMPSPGQTDDPSGSSVWVELLSNKKLIYSRDPQTR